MKKKTKILTMIGIIGSLLFLLQNFDLAWSKDPDYPTKPITYYIGYGPGGSTDIISRALCDIGKKHFGQPFTPVNKVGAGGTLAAMTVMTSKPDGYTFGCFATTAVLMGPLTGEAPYKDISGFTLIGNLVDQVYPILSSANLPWKTWKELMEWGKKNPGGVKVGMTGSRSGTSMGVAMSQLEKAENVKFTYVPFKSSAEVLHATLGGHIHLSGAALIPSMLEFAKEGKLRILTYMGSAKIPGYENIPSFPDLYGFSIINLVGTLGPKGLPDYVLKKWDDLYEKVIKEPDFINVANQMYMPIMYMNRAQITKFVEEMTPKVAEILKILKAEEEKEKK